jgi:2-dehydropantoate 2-reductase
MLDEERAGADPERLQIAVLGPGGVGGLLAALLAHAGDRVTCLAGPETVAALREHGLRITSGRFGELAEPIAAAGRLYHEVDVCLVTVKATQLEAALDRVPPEVLGNALLVPMLNGLEHVALLRRHYPDAVVAAAAIRIESTRTGPGKIRHDSPFASMELALPPSGGQPDRDRVRRLAGRLGQTGLDVRVREDESGMLWDKLCFLAPMALLTTHAGAPVGVVREERREDLTAVVSEVAAVARAEGAAGANEKVLEFFASVPAGMQSSMQRDAAAGRPIELEAIGGAVLRAAARSGVPVPVTTRLVEDLRSRAATALGAS